MVGQNVKCQIRQIRTLSRTKNLFQICAGICLANGETIKNMTYLKKIGVTHVLNTAEKHVQVHYSSVIIEKLSLYFSTKGSAVGMQTRDLN